jgi:hypothetical protein
VENTPSVEFIVPELGGFTYSRLSKDFTIPLKHIKTACLQPMPICNTLTQGDDNYFNLALIKFAQQTSPSSMQYLHFILFL